jgi:hypothetical protein
MNQGSKLPGRSTFDEEIRQVSHFGNGGTFTIFGFDSLLGHRFF